MMDGATRHTADLLIVGAGFAGLAAARRAAERGLRVTVLERKAEPGRPLHTTGILVREAHDELAAQFGAIPPALLRPVPGVRVYAPSLKRFDLFSGGYAFYATDTPALLRWMAEAAAAAGARIVYGAPVADLRNAAAGVRLAAAGAVHDAAWLLGADGAKSAVAEALGLGRNRRFLVGLEAEYAGVGGVDERVLHTFIDRRLAPGYIGWVVPGCGVTQIGIAAKRAEKPQFDAFVKRIAPLFDLSRAEIVARRSGVIPCGGVIHPFARDRAVLVGDAAGMVSPLTAGGIFTALKFGARAADLFADNLAGRCADPAAVLAAEYPRFRTKRLLRRALDLGPPDWLMNLMLGTRPMQGLARLVYFHTKGLGSKGAWQDLARRPEG